MLNLPKLIGHRGVKDLSPENTLDSIQLAYKLGLKWVEVDVKVSRDLIPILLHDDKLDRTIDKRGSPIEFDYNELRQLDAGFFFYKHSTNIFIPSLEDVLKLCKQKKIGLNIELKPNKGFELDNVESIEKVLSTFDFNNKFYFSSFDLLSLVSMKKLMPNAYYGFLVHSFNKEISLENIIDICKKYNFICCGLNKNIINIDIVKNFKKNNIFINAYSEKNFKLNEGKELWSIGINSLFIDDPIEFKIY